MWKNCYLALKEFNTQAHLLHSVIFVSYLFIMIIHAKQHKRKQMWQEESVACKCGVAIKRSTSQSGTQ